jgi:tetratricopeptide (TPR) repeat protein
VLVNVCPALYAAAGYGSEEATRANARLAVLTELVGDRPDLFEAKWALVMNTIANAGSRDVPPRALQLLRMAGDDPLRKQAAHYAIADAAFWLGEFEMARTHAAKALALYRPEQHPDLLARFGEDLSISCGAYLAWSEYFRGFPEQARITCDNMLARARALDHPHTLGLALCFASVLHRWMDCGEKALALGAETIEVSRRYGFSVWLAAGEMAHGWALARQGNKEGIAELEAGIAGMKMAIGGISVVFLSALAEGYGHLQMYPEALAVLAQAKEEAARTGDGHYSAELFRLEGECLLKLPNGDAGQASSRFNEALAVSRRQGARSLELLAAESIARQP